MGFGLPDVASFAAGGPLGYGLYKAASGGGNTDVAQVPLETPEQKAAREGLLSFASTGTFGNYTAGTPYTGSLGDFGMTAVEKAAQGALNTRTAGQDYGSLALKDLITTDKYNPLNQEGLYQSLGGTIDRTTRDASDAFKRSAAFGGNLYSTDTVRNLGQIQERGAESKAATLASLYDNYIGRKTGAIPQAIAAQDSAIGQAYQYGGLPRTLETAKDQAAYTEFQRQRQEQQQQVTALSSVAGTPSNFGVPSVSVPNANPWLDVMNLLASFGGKAAGAYAGGYGAAAGAKAGA